MNTWIVFNDTVGLTLLAIPKLKRFVSVWHIFSNYDPSCAVLHQAFRKKRLFMEETLLVRSWQAKSHVGNRQSLNIVARTVRMKH